MSRRSTPPAPTPYESGSWGTVDNPCPSPRTIAAHVDGELDVARARAVDEHLDQCDSCASDAHQLENLSGCLRAWSRTRGAVEPPPRLLGRVLRDIARDGGALRREAEIARRRWVGAAAAAAVFVALGVGVGLFGARSSAATRSTSSLDAGAADQSPSARAPVSESVRGSEPVRGGPPETGAIVAKALPDDGLRTASVSVDPRWTSSASEPDAVLRDPAVAEAFARWLPLVAAERRVGEELWDLGGRSFPAWALPEYEHVREWGRWMAERERLVQEPPTRDPADAGLALADVLALPAPGSRGASVSVPATPRAGGLVLRALSRRDSIAPTPADDPKVAPAPFPDVAGPAVDLASAVRSGRVRLLPDVTLDPLDVGIHVLPTPPALPTAGPSSGGTVPSGAAGVSPAALPSEPAVLIPIGEFLSGGAGDRVVAQAAWLPSSPTGYVVRLATRPIARRTGRVGLVPQVVGRLAGPEVRAVLFRGESAAALATLVHAQLRGAGLLPPESDGIGLREGGTLGGTFGGGGARERGTQPSLLSLYDDGSDDVVARGLLQRLGDGAVGFVAADPSGRFQGLERVDLAGEAGRALLARLVSGYLAEARSRSSADGARTGVQTSDVLGALAHRPPRLAPSKGDAPVVRSDAGASPVKPAGPMRGIEPHTGVLLQGVTSTDARVPLVSGLVREFR